MTPLMTASVAWYVTGRFYLSSEDATLQDLGYFLHLEGLPGSLFEDPSGKVGEATARLTFRSTPFKPITVTNGGLTLGRDPVGDFTVYLKQPGHAHADFARPETFSDGLPIATFRRASVVVGGAFSAGSRALSLNVFTARLVWSAEFELEGRLYDLKALLPDGITQWGEAGPEPIADPPKGFSVVQPFLGSAVALGGGR
ncbi:hypothetical protein LY474_05375 [Myxococcus stipitatus]|uniref:hypothetical protein n=1 Tax=Myxococcus stipitatus TaxID=83455 RepID=UPI001F3B7A78|nr:hypothetical protein [Myxococcus stipitatus]MCE9667241.1 hypothetical protein [Myxococcus stipitatus]